MAIKKQEFYEGAALHVLARSGLITTIRYQSPFFVLNGHRTILLKYSTKVRSPWSFTFMPDEQAALRALDDPEAVIGLICGSDGIAAVRYASFLEIAGTRDTSLHVACYRKYGEHYEVSGPDGVLGRKVAPSAWQRLLCNGRST